jgi:hypothetical protein
MINIKNREPEVCTMVLVDIKGRVYYETHMEPFEKLTLDIKDLFSGIYTLIFKTETTSFTQQIVKL